MNSSLRSAASRRLASSSTRRLPTSGTRSARWNSTASSSNVSASGSGNAANYALAGAAGGGMVLLGGYGYYHFSGAKTLVDSAKSVKASAKNAKDMFVEKTPSPNEALKYLRNLSKTYVAVIPGASTYVDKTFDELDQLSNTHGTEMNEILSKATDELRDTIQNGQMDLPTAEKVISILRARGEELTKLAASAGSGAINKILDEHPEAKEKLAGGWDEMKRFADQSGAPEAKKIVEDTTAQVVGIFKDGFSVESISKARDLVKQKTEEVKKLADKGSKEAYDKALQTAQPYLDKFPEVKKLIEDNASLLASSSAGGSAAAIWSVLKSSASDKKLDKDKLTELVTSKINEAKEKAKEKGADAGGSAGAAWSGLQQWIQSSVPEDAKDKIPDLSALVNIARDNSEDAQKLAKETYDEVLKVLKTKAEEAKKLAGDAKDEAKDAKDSKGDEKPQESDQDKKKKKN